MASSVAKRKRNPNTQQEAYYESLSLEVGLTAWELQGVEALSCLRQAKWDSTTQQWRHQRAGVLLAGAPTDECWEGCESKLSASPRCEERHDTKGRQLYQGAFTAGDVDSDDSSSSNALAGRNSRQKLQCDKEWSAMTTWLRMNLHRPRTAKRQILFVGRLAAQCNQWIFDLNQYVDWADVSTETKLRLRGLPQEAEAAFALKYPNRPRNEWVNKLQKYRPGNCSPPFMVPLGDMLYSLQDIYFRFEGAVKDVAMLGTTERSSTGAAAVSSSRSNLSTRNSSNRRLLRLPSRFSPQLSSAQ